MERDKDLRLQILAVDDDAQMLEVIASSVEDLDVEVLRAESAESALQLFEKHRPQLVLTDLRLHGMNGMELLEKLLEIDPGTDVILVTGHYTTESAVEAIQKGAADYLTKPLSIETLRARVSKFIDERKRRNKSKLLDGELIKAFQFEGMIGRSPHMLDVYERIQRVAPHFRTVLITGATGTGKELVARALHRLSPVAGRTFAVCNCAAVVETLFESELFGYVKGAFTGASQDKVGLFEHANGGTVFLDEIGEMPLAAQSKLLRVLQNQEVQRVGSPLTRKVDVRIIAATNRDLSSEVADKKFREDLYYRLSMIEIPLPKLAERREDLPLLQRHFVEQFAKQYGKVILGISRRAQSQLAEHHWPGNVRELENVIGNACMMTEEEVIDIRDLPEKMVSRVSLGNADDDLISFELLQRRYAQKVLNKVDGNKARAAEILGVSRTTLYKILGTEPDDGLASGHAAKS
jgi:DNA-binding NtrC family response regulator